MAKNMDLVAKPNVTSPVWEHFGFEPDEEGKPKNLDEAVCRICSKKINVTRGNTTNLASHLRTTHRPLYDAMKGTPSTSGGTGSALRQLGVSEAFARVTKYNRDSNKWRALTTSVTQYLVAEMVPFRTVEKPSFRAMLQSFDKQYELPGRTYFSETAIPEMYLKVKNEILAEIKEVDHFSVTTDMWSSVNMMPYMSLTLHYLTPNWELKSKCLETVFTPESHTKEYLADALRSSFREWFLDESKLCCITTDNGANIVAAVRELGWQWLNCFGHNLHLAVTNAMASEKERTARAMGLCRTLVTTFSQSWQKKRKLQREQDELKLPRKSLVLDCPTRWGTKQKMVERVLEQAPAISRVLVDDRRSQHLVPTWQDLAVLESVNAALKPVQDFTDALSSEKTVTASAVKPVLDLLRTDLLLPAQEDTELTCRLKLKMTEVLEKKYSAPSTQKLLEKASFLDPRYKSSTPSEELRDALLEEMMEIPEQDDGAAQPRPSTSTEGGDKKRKLADLLGQKRDQTQSTPIPKRLRVDTELTRYSQEEALDSHSDPLAWWRDNQSRYPLLAKVARKFMTICATSTASERVFSAAGNIVTPLRASLKPDRVNMLVFLARNTKSQ